MEGCELVFLQKQASNPVLDYPYFVAKLLLYCYPPFLKPCNSKRLQANRLIRLGFGKSFLKIGNYFSNFSVNKKT